jgi:hypothetical protein
MTSRLTATQRSLIAEALTLSRLLVHQADTTDAILTERRRDRMRAIQQELQACTHPIHRDHDAPADIPLAVRKSFVQAALLVSRYFAVGGVGWRGTLSSPTLSQYCPDPVPTSWTTPPGIARMGERFDLSADTMAEIVCHLNDVDAEIVQQRQLMEAVLGSVGITMAAAEPLPSEPFAALFQELFDGIVISPDALSVVFTPTQLYFCLDFPPPENFRQWGELSSPEHLGALRALHQRLSNFTFAKFKRFPTFGPCEPSGIRRAWAEAVCDRLQQAMPHSPTMTPEQIIQRLSKSVGVLPRKDAEMFLVHDIWGHYWQLLFSQFNSDYAALADCGEALRMHETAYTPAGPLSCGDLFQFGGATVTIDEIRAMQFFHGEVRQRLGLLFTHLLGELVADIAEFKFAWANPNAAHQLPSSSAFTDYPANLDLSLADLDFLFLRVLQPLLEIHLSPLEASPLEIELLSNPSLHPLADEQMPRLEVNLKRAIAQLHHLFLSEYEAAYLPHMEAEGSLFAEVAMNLLQLQNVVNTLYTDAQFTQAAPIPFQDVLIVFISHHCSGDSYAEFWKIDNILADFFIPCWHLLRQDG